MKLNAVPGRGCQETGKVWPSGCPQPFAARQQGIALAIVVWFIAGMSLLVAGIVSHARVDTKMAQLHTARAKVVAAGDGAIQLMLADRLLREGPVADEGDLSVGEYWLGNSKVSVTLYPATGFVDLNNAPQTVLAGLFLIIGQLPEVDANFLADNVVKWRGGSVGSERTKKKSGRLRSIEDLLRVEGMNRALFDTVRDFIVVGDGGGSATDWAVAPEVLLQVLEKTNPGKLDAVSRRRETLASPRPDGGDATAKSRSLSGTYRIDALVEYGDMTWLRRRWVLTGSTSRYGLLPWQIVRTEPPRVYEQLNDGNR